MKKWLPILMTLMPAAAFAQVEGAASIVHINSDKMMTMVLVDGGAMLEEGDCTTPKSCVIYDIAPGEHEIDVRAGLAMKKVLFRDYMKIPAGSEVWVKIKDGKAEIYNVQPRKDIVHAPSSGGSSTTTTHSTTTTTTVDGVGVPGISAGITVVDPETGEAISVQAGIGGPGIGGGVTITETTVTETHGDTHAPVSGIGSLELTSTDGESFTVFIDGKERGTCNCMDGESIKVRRVEAGEHVLVIKDFMGDEVIAKGRVWIEPDFLLKLGVGDGRVEAFNRVDAWHAR